MSIGKRKKTIKIEALEGSHRALSFESLLQTNITEIPGTENSYRTYSEQLFSTYEKYNAFSSYGNQLVRSIIDLRTAFIASEGISIACEDDNTSSWIENFLIENRLKGSVFFDGVRGSEIMGQSLMEIQPVINESGEVKIKAKIYPTKKQEYFKPVYNSKNIFDDSDKISIKVSSVNESDTWLKKSDENLVYVRTGGIGNGVEKPTTKIGAVLTDIDNYDRALKDIRRNNYVFARITPVFEVDTEGEAKALTANLKKIRWKIGKAFIGKARFRYETPATTTHQNLLTELTSTLKAIAGTTGIPVHWLGYVDLMSNRSTADSLYEFVKHSTSQERIYWEEGIYDLIYKAQRLYIDSGGKGINLNRDFTVKLPLISYNGFVDRIRGLNMAYSDGAISLDDYMNQIPGVDPLKTRKNLEIERQREEENLTKMGLRNFDAVEEEE